MVCVLENIHNVLIFLKDLFICTHGNNLYFSDFSCAIYSVELYIVLNCF